MEKKKKNRKKTSQQTFFSCTSTKFFDFFRLHDKTSDKNHKKIGKTKYLQVEYEVVIIFFLYTVM